VSADLPGEVTFLGGRDCVYASQDAYSILQGVLTIAGGTLVIDRMVIE